ncbi:MAG: amidohydrolase [Williamsia sp.]|nr:amidohydrolase [Williamsia sp.]
MRIISLEEHISFPELVAKIPEEKKAKRKGLQPPMMEQVARDLEDISDQRLKSMDDSGISLQILSVVGPGADLLPPDEAPPFARQNNDLIAERIAAHPGRFAAFAHLPMTDPAAAAAELERSVKTHGFKGALINGLTGGQFLDNPVYAPLLQKAQDLQTPIYLHPGLPPQAVADAYYSNLPKQAGVTLGVAGWGWHSETALHVLRLIFSGTFDKYPQLKLIIGHMGEMLPMMMARIDTIFKVDAIGVNRRTASQTLKDQVYITTSGIFTQPPLQIAADTFGTDNILFSVDYPFSKNSQGREFLDSLALPKEQVEKIAHGNAERLLKV